MTMSEFDKVLEREGLTERDELAHTRLEEWRVASLLERAVNRDDMENFDSVSSGDVYVEKRVDAVTGEESYIVYRVEREFVEAEGR